MKSTIIFTLISTLLFLFVTAQIDETNNSVSIVTPTTTAAAIDSNNPIYPPITITITETSTTTTIPAQTNIAPTTSTTSNDASR